MSSEASESYPTLDLDILLEVATFVPWEDSSALFHTCRSLYFEAPKVVLQYDEVHLKTDDDVASFLGFLHATFDDKRYTYVRSLNIASVNEPTFSNGPLQLLALDLPRMPNLSMLHMSDSEQLLSDVPDLLDGLAALTSLRNLSVSESDWHTAKLLQNLRSKLVYARVDFMNFAGQSDLYAQGVAGEEGRPPCHPAALLANSRTTIQELECKYWNSIPKMPPGPPIVYPEMHRLNIMCFTSLFLTIPLVQAYPNLRYLSFTTGYGKEPSYRLREDSCLAHREKKLRVHASTENMWESLRQFRGNIIDLYLLGFTCYIDQTTSTCWNRYLLLSYARPRELSLQTLWGGPDSLPVVVAAMRGDGGSRLEQLTLSFSLDANEVAVDVGALLRTLLSSLEHAPLRNIQLTIDITKVDPRPPSLDPSSDPAQYWWLVRGISPPQQGAEDCPLNATERSAEECDVVDYLRGFARLVGTLRQAIVCVVGPRGRWWEATLQNSGAIQLNEGECFTQMRESVYTEEL
ncbi:hypothetical protein C2E23DRAFT_886701 [Lenzites betulinus]|nr:hypothetical protein C2E23DRAFT_886701 [Lenzites betulinus]